MNDQSPPKRVTRARAAAKIDTGVKIATAASKAKARAVSTTKRKTRADEGNDELNEIQNEEPQPELPKITRGRAKKAIHKDEEPNEMVEPEAPKPTRGRAKKAAVVQPDPEPDMEEESTTSAPARSVRGRPKKAAVEAAAPEAPRTTRGRLKKVEIPEEASAMDVEDLPKKVTRARAVTVSKATAPKKTVKFEEPGKENIEPGPVNGNGKPRSADVGTGLRAKPVRKPAAPATRATRGRSKVEENEHKSSPLSPKKATQVATAKEHNSDDELASNEKTPMKPLMKSPIKAPGSVFGTAKKLDFSTSITVNRAVGQDMSGSILGSPARRPPQSSIKATLKSSPQRSNLGNSLMQPAIKLPLPHSKPVESSTTSNFKASLLQSPARRPPSPIKVSEDGSPSRSRNTNPMISGATPITNTFKISRFATPRTLNKSVMRPGQMLPPSAFKSTSTGSPMAKDPAEGSGDLCAPSLSFSGRLSSIMPREADPALSPTKPIVENNPEQSSIEAEVASEPMVVDEVADIVQETMIEHTATPLNSPPRNSTGIFELRESDENPFMDSDSEDELASASPKYSSSRNLFASAPASPIPFTALAKTPQTDATLKPASRHHSLRQSQIGFTPLAKQLSDWMAASPEKSGQSDSGEDTASPTSTPPRSIQAIDAVAGTTTTKSTFFEDEMTVRDEMSLAPELEESDDIVIDEENFTPIEVIDEDLALAEEAAEMSMLDIEGSNGTEDVMDVISGEAALPNMSGEAENEEVERLPTEFDLEVATCQEVEIMEDEPDLTVSISDDLDERTTANTQDLASNAEDDITPSEASQDYGDENAIPIDPVLIAMSAPVAISTPNQKMPKRVLAERVCHTVSKVPLKPAAEESPMGASPMRRSASISRLPASRPSGNLTRSNTVISYSPTKSSRRARQLPQEQQEDVVMEEVLPTPSKPGASNWSTIGTPARTPRRDLNAALLKGAVVFVDVHTSEGADASSLFTELLTQMGARCVKSWNWNPNSDDGSKIGITHVVFKDGGKRTLEKAKQTGGVVTCVGVGWVLDCERENRWLPESSYSVDTAMIPRGGHRRRKSMEPRALANLNGTLLPSTSTTPVRKSMSPMKNPNSFAETPLTSKARRRDSVQWTRTSSSSSSPSDGKLDGETFMLSPVPTTPSPDFISAYGDETPSAQTPYLIQNEQLLQQTAPVRKFGNFGEEEGMGLGKGFLSEKKDESVVLRLMAARRKSLQWAPKVGSPLARGEGWR